METVEKRTVTVTRESEGVYIATNPAGASIRFGHGAPDSLSCVEMLLASIACCSGTDVDVVTSRRAEPTTFTITINAEKVTGDGGNILRDIVAEFDVRFPEGEDGDKARARVEPALKAAHERTCTVSRTVEAGVPVTLRTTAG